MKVTKKQKDANPKIYGYGSVAQLEADPARFGDDPDNPLTNWVPFRDADDDLRFVPCTQEYFYSHRNEIRNEKRKNQKERERFPISTDQLYEDHQLEIVDPSYYEEIELQKEKEVTDYMWELINELPEYDRLILTMRSHGLTDTEIGNELNRGQSAIQERRVKLFKQLKEKITKFQKNR